MSFVINKGAIENLDFYSHYPKYKDALLALDEHRFRGLGDKHTQEFVKHAVTVSKKFGLVMQSDVAYLMFVMQYLGSYFFDDPRYKEIIAPLYIKPTTVDRRIEEMRVEFVQFAHRYLGKNLQKYVDALNRFSNEIRLCDLEAPKSNVELLRILRVSYPDIDPDSDIIAIGKSAANDLGLKHHYGTNVCGMLGFWLGTGFYKDPLYPWVRDIIKKPESVIEKTIALQTYAINRLEKQILLLEKRNDQ